MFSVLQSVFGLILWGETFGVTKSDDEMFARSSSVNLVDETLLANGEHVPSIDEYSWAICQSGFMNSFPIKSDKTLLNYS